MAEQRITRLYGDFRGADFRGEEVNLMRSPDCLNVWRNYKHTSSIETRPGLRKIAEVTDKTAESIYRLLYYKDKLCVITNLGLYTLDNGTLTPVQDSSEHYPIQFAFEYGNNLYFSDSQEYYVYDGTDVEAVNKYIPIISNGRKPAGGGSIGEDVNLLCQGVRENSFVVDGTSLVYTLSDENISGVEWVKYADGSVIDQSTYTVDTAKGTVTFDTPPVAQGTEGQDSLFIRYTKEYNASGTRFYNPILDCTIAQEFDNRVFVTGNPRYPNRIWHSSLNNPGYFSTYDYYDDGADATLIKGLVPGNNALWVFREPSDTNTNVFYHTPALDEDYGKIYPSSHSSVSLGCVGKAINFNDDIVFFSQKGMEGISGDITTEQFVAHRSTVVDRAMVANKEYRDMILAEWEGYLLVIMPHFDKEGAKVGSEVYLADSRAIYTNENHVEYEWYYWELDKEIVCATVHEGTLYVGTEDGEICSLTDTQKPLHSYWVTPKDKFNTPHKTKTTNKRGCVVEATGDVSVYAKTEDTEFESVGDYQGVEDYFVPRIKQKKFKDLQLKFESNTRFSLETATLEVVVGGYIKR